MAGQRTSARPKSRAPATCETFGEVLAWAGENVARRSALTEPQPATLPSFEVLKRPGQLEQALENIKVRFSNADSRHLAAIDQEVMNCVRIANFLAQDIMHSRKYLEGRWFQHWCKHGRERIEALRFVFKLTHADPKKASFYYRATFKFFEEGVQVEDYPARVRAEGGYQQLADSNVRFPRAKVPKGDPEGGHVREDDDNEDDDNEDDEEREPRTKRGRTGGTKPQPAPEGDTSDAEECIAKGDEDEVSLVAMFEGEGRAFLDLPTPCLATVLMRVADHKDGVRHVTVLYAMQAE